MADTVTLHIRQSTYKITGMTLKVVLLSLNDWIIFNIVSIIVDAEYTLDQINVGKQTDTHW